MIFGRREKRPAILTFDRILVPLAGTEADDAALRLTAILLSGTPGQAFLLHVIEIPFERQLDAQDPEAVAFAASRPHRNTQAVCPCWPAANHWEAV